MSLMRIVTFPDAILTTPGHAVDPRASATRTLVRDMVDTLHSTGGLGLSACQIGVPATVFIVDGRIAGVRRPIVAVNPVVVAADTDVVFGEEGCLSILETYVVVPRARSIVLEAYDLDGRLRTYDCRGNELLARVFQHEYDHTRGVTMLEASTNL